MQAFLTGIKEKLPAIKQGFNALKPLLQKGQNMESQQEISNNEVSQNFDLKTAEAEESPLKKYGMYAAIALVIYMLYKKKK